MILYGDPVKGEIKKELTERIKKLGRKPVLAVVQVGDRADSNTYVRNKQKFGEEIGATVKIVKMERWKDGKIEEKQKELEEEIKKLNTDENVDGIILQLPLPEGFDSEKVLSEIMKKKDADGLVDSKMERLKDARLNEEVGQGKIGEREKWEETIPATARGILALLDFYKIEVAGKKAAVIGRSKLVGAPVAELLRQRGAQVQVCHRGTQNMAEICKASDILVVAAGQINLVNKEFVNENQVIIDVGINKNAEGKLVGDVNFGEVEPLVAAITPVPGGVGLLTVACLFQNLLDLAEADVL